MYIFLYVLRKLPSLCRICSVQNYFTITLKVYTLHDIQYLCELCDKLCVQKQYSMNDIHSSE